MDKKLQQSVLHLKEAIAARASIKNSNIANASISKCFEVALEYAWKAIKRDVEESGLEAFSPKDAIKLGAGLGLIRDPVQWITFINNRNLSVHDYLGVDDLDYFESIKEFVVEVEFLIKKLR